MIKFNRNSNASGRGQVSGIVRRFATERFLGSFGSMKESNVGDRPASRRARF